jgi:hypothetical protein
VLLFRNFFPVVLRSVEPAGVLGGRLASALRAIVIGIWAVVGAVIAGSVVGYEVVLHCEFSCDWFV